MRSRQRKTLNKNVILITFLIMVAINALANILPINGVTTGKVSESFPNLFTPAPLTFSIWGLIYLLLGAFTLYRLGFFRGDRIIINGGNEDLLQKTGWIFAVSSIANAAWIFCWHFYLIPLSMLFMTVILICLAYITWLINKQKLSSREKAFVRIPFSVYFGWITVAAIANVQVLFVSLKWELPEPLWTVILIIAGTLIGAFVAIKNRDIPYGLVLVWAYLGIWLKHTSESGFSGRYPLIINTVLACIALLGIVLIYTLLSGRRRDLKNRFR